MQPDKLEIARIIDTALNEDIGKGDFTSQAIINPNKQVSFAFIAKEPMVICGIDIVVSLFNSRTPSIHCQAPLQDGTEIDTQQIILSGKGNALTILAHERVALNLLQHMSGIATYTRKFVDLVRATQAKILDTRKTTPGLREIEKYAVCCGGGYNHRFRLDDGVLIKDNHINICGSITKAVQQARDQSPFLTRIEVECETIEQVKEALKSPVDVIMLDNMSINDIKQAVKLNQHQIPMEASGNVTLDNVKAIAETGVDYISVGRITHSSPNVDISLDIK